MHAQVFPDIVLTMLCNNCDYYACPSTRKRVFPEKLGIIKHDVVFFYLISLISQKLPAM